MPRKARLDAPGALHHIIARGIERCVIFKNNADRDNFVERLGDILPETNTQCFAWALLPNHFHLLLQTGSVPISTVMLRLMTGHAVSFNKRHDRHGHLFQNRYKSILCDRQSYLLELVRYIHLNPLRAMVIRDLQELDYFVYSGHSAIMGRQKIEWQNINDVLLLFSSQRSMAIQQYRQFIEEGINQDKMPELSGCGLVGKAAKAMQEKGVKPGSDERILGNTDFVDSVLTEAQENLKTKYELSAKGYNFDDLLQGIADHMSIPPEIIMTPGKERKRVRARSVLCLWAKRELGMTMTDIASRLKMTVAAASISAQRGEKIVRESNLKLNEILNF